MSGKKYLFIPFLFIAALSVPPPADAKVWTVGRSGQFTEIVDAVAAASEGDTLLVYPGTYSSFVIDGISLNVIADWGADVFINHTAEVQNLQENQIVNFVGLVFYKYGCREEGLILKNNAGAIRVEDCGIHGASGYNWWPNPDHHPDGWNGAVIEYCDDVVFSRCTITGGEGSSCNDEDFQTVGNGGYGIHAFVAKNLVFYDCIVSGGGGGSDWDNEYLDGGHGGHACYGGFSTIFTSGSKFTGGAGGWGGFYGGAGGDGGHGILAGLAFPVRLLDCICLGGSAGLGQPEGTSGLPVSGPIEDIAGEAHSLTMASPIKEPGSVHITLEGKGGSLAVLLFSPAPASMFIGDLHGQWLLSFSHPLQIASMGIIPPSGTLYLHNTPVPDLGPSFDMLILYIQSVFRDGSGVITLGAPRTLLALDGDTY